MLSAFLARRRRRAVARGTNLSMSRYTPLSSVVGSLRRRGIAATSQPLSDRRVVRVERGRAAQALHRVCRVDPRHLLVVQLLPQRARVDDIDVVQLNVEPDFE